ncbi:MAG: NUDIX hydrolase [Deltaproteobacteria bacterium]|nr:NUDIX hydrolase [Deltaproteobacteria bacterium]
MSDTPTPPRPASTVIVLKDDFSVLLIQRNKAINFFGGAFAFPGGRVEESDAPPSGASISMPVTALRRVPWTKHALRPADLGLNDEQRAYVAYLAAAAREVKEEVGLDVAIGSLVPWSRWITPVVEPKRYDTLFFLARVPPGADVQIDGDETVLHRWLTPAAAFEAQGRGEISLPPPTQVTLRELAGFASVDALFAAATQAEVPEVFPELVAKDDALWLVLPGDPWHSQKALRPWPDGLPTRAKVDNGIRFA